MLSGYTQTKSLKACAELQNEFYSIRSPVRGRGLRPLCAVFIWDLCNINVAEKLFCNSSNSANFGTYAI